MFKTFFSGLPRAFNRLFCWRHLFLGILAGTLTYLCVMSGFDWYYYEHTRTIFFFALPSAIIGFFVPILVPVLLYIYGDVWKKELYTRTAGLIAQAGVIAWLLSSTLKAFTGRMQPEFYTHLSTVDMSREWLFGFWRHGIFWGWPSSHTTVAVAISLVIAHQFRNKPLVVVLSLLYGAYVALGVSISIHWFSDALAGIIFGYVAYRAVVSGSTSPSPYVR